MKVEVRDVVHAIHALKALQPSGSEHYRSGWDDGLEAAKDAVRELASLAAGTAQPVLESHPDRPCCYDSSVTDCRHGRFGCCVPMDEVCPLHH